MSQFFDQYNAILEKSLQKVRLKVDPSNKCAEDFAQFDGYVGYILAETDDNIEFFCGRQIVSLPKNAIIIEQGFLQKAGVGAANFIRGAAGQNTGSSWAGTLGNIAGGTARGFGKAALALHGIDPSKVIGQQQQPTNVARDSHVSNADADTSKAFIIKNSNGIATIDINGIIYGIIAGSIKNQGNQVLLNSFVFDYIINNFIVEAGFNGLSPNVGGIPVKSLKTNTQQVDATVTDTAQKNLHDSQTTTATVQYIPISKITAQNLKQQKALKVPLSLELQPLNIKATNTATPTMHQVMFTLAPNGQEVQLIFLQ